MNFGLVGKNLTHSYSKYIHENLEINDYKLLSINQIEEVLKMDFDGFNITNPFKSDVIKYLDDFDDIVKETKSVNTVLKQNNKLKGFNTDYYGFESLLKKNNIQV